MPSNYRERYSSVNPGLNIRRSRFRITQDIKLDFQPGFVYPIWFHECLPSDNDACSVSFVVRSSTPKFPALDNAFIDLRFFYVPNYQLNYGFTRMIGPDPAPAAWTSTVSNGSLSFFYDQVVSASTYKNSVYDYFGIPLKAINSTAGVNPFPLAAYYKIYNDWYRSENLQNPIQLPANSMGKLANAPTLSNVSTPNSSFLASSSDCVSTAPGSYGLCYSNRFHDYFTSCLPSPQKGQPSYIPIEDAVVNTVDQNVASTTQAGIRFQSTSGQPLPSGVGLGLTGSSMESFKYGVPTSGTVSVSTVPVYPSNLVAQNGRFSVEALRESVQTQKMQERDARGGTRYNELILAHFGVQTGDSRIWVPEYIGGCSVPIEQRQVEQTARSAGSSTSSDSVGATMAYSKTVHFFRTGSHASFAHGFILCMMQIRNSETWSQGLAKEWTRKSRLDYYWPEFANIGEQPVYKDEIYYQPGQSSSIFGYQQAWESYRTAIDRCAGGFRPTGEQSEDPTDLTAWTYANNLLSAPTLSAEFLRTDPTDITHTMVTNDNQFQDFFGDFCFIDDCVRPLPVQSIPGLVDHN